MPDYPQTVVELRDWFASEAACREYLQRLRWPDGGALSGLRKHEDLADEASILSL